jgi:hypothetical protein
MTLSESERPVRLGAARDPAAHFRLAALQSQAARRLSGKDPLVEATVDRSRTDHEMRWSVPRGSLYDAV